MKHVKSHAYRISSLCSVALLTLALAGCDHDGNPAAPKPGVRKPVLQTPDSALYCVMQGIATKSSQLYEYVLPDTLLDGTNFHAFFDPQDLVEYANNTGTTPPADWTTPDEKTFIGQYTTLVPVTSYSVALAPDASRADFLGPDETIYYRHYRVWFGSPAHYLGAGLADLYFRRVGVNQEWKMTRWVDRRDTTDLGVRTIGRQRLGPPRP
jgi:hypothetical protein